MEKRGLKETEIGLIPEDWGLRKFSDLIEIIGGGTPKTSIPEYWNGGIPWLSVVDFNNNFRTVEFTEKTISKIGLENSSTKLLKKGDIIISARGTVGAIAQLGRDMAFNQSCYGLKAKKELINNDFLYYLLKFSLNILKQTTHGSTFDTITTNTFDLLNVPFPPIIEQKRVAEILSTLDNKIELNQKMNQTLEKIGQAIFKHWFIDFEFPDGNGKPYKSNGGEMVDSELGEIPKGWKIEKINNLSVEVTDYVANGSFASLKNNVKLFKTKNYALFIRNTDLKDDFISTRRYVDKHSYEFLSKTKLFGGEVIISNVGDVGSVFLCPFYEFPMTLGNNIVVLKSKELNYFFYYLFKSYFGQGLIKSISSGSVQLKFNKTDFRNLEIVTPDEKIIENFNSLAININKKIFNNKIENEQLTKIRNFLLPKLMSGKIRLNKPINSNHELSKELEA